METKGGRILVVCDHFKELISLIGQHPDYFEIGKPVAIESIKKAEEHLGVTFPASLVRYFAAFGTISAGPLEFYGVVGTDCGEGKIPDGIWFTERKRDQLNLPNNYFVLLNNEGDEFHCVDLDTGGIEIWNTAERKLVGSKASCIFEYIVRECAEYMN